MWTAYLGVDSSAEVVLRGLLCWRKVKPLPVRPGNARVLRLAVCWSDSTNHVLPSHEPGKVWYGLTAAVIIAIGIERKV